MPGLHTFRITDAGLQVFSRTLGLSGKKKKSPPSGVFPPGFAELDKMMGGGIPEGDSILVAGPSGTGKSLLATQFMAEGIRRGEPGNLVGFEERPTEYLVRAGNFGLDFGAPQKEGRLSMLSLRPLDLSVDETMHELVDAVQKIGAKRLVLDSLSGFEMALSPGFRQDFRESLYRLISALTGIGVTILSTVEVEDSFTQCPLAPTRSRFSPTTLSGFGMYPSRASFAKFWSSSRCGAASTARIFANMKSLSGGLKIGNRLEEYQGLTTGVPVP